MKYQHLLAPMVMPNGVVLKNHLLSSNALPHFLQGPETWLNDPILVYQAQVARNAAIVTMGDWTDPNQHSGMHHGDGCHFPALTWRIRRWKTPLPFIAMCSTCRGQRQ